MKHPFRSDFQTYAEYEKASVFWERLTERMSIRLRGMYDVTPEITEKPGWCRKADLCHIDLEKRPDEEDLATCIKTLSSFIVGSDKKAVNLCHGMFASVWIIWVKMEPEGDIKEAEAA